MTRLELLTILLSIKALLESDNKDKALELINDVISEAKMKDTSANNQESLRGCRIKIVLQPL